MTKGYLVRRREIEDLEVQAKHHFLNKNAQANNRSLGDQTGITGFGFHILEVEPGHDTTEHHFHYREDECVYILSGNGTARLGDNTYEISEGDFLGYRKGGLPHSIINTGDTTMRMIVVGQRGDTDIVDYPDKQKRMFRTKGLDWNVMDMADIKNRK